MIKYARYSVVLFLLFTGLTAWAASLDGKVLGTDKTPVEGAIVSAVVEGEDFSAISGADGANSLELPSGKGYVRFVTEGYYQPENPLNERLDYDEIILVPLMSP